MKQTFILSPIFLITILFSLGCTSKVEETKTPALFDSKREAEKAAKKAEKKAEKEAKKAERSAKKKQ